MGIFEMLEMDSELREMAFHKTPTHKIRDQAIASGMRTLMQDGVRKVLQGFTTIDEVIRITAGDLVVAAS
jgi:type II secretory ATPase GspE/PulE/Tfp pilus assembly ATPase PilB-like protein